jgi:Predicted solute binding protein
MGKASSAKKVARAARAGGRISSGQPRSLLFPGALLLVIVLGTSLIVYARADRRNEDLGGVPQLGDHIHQAIAVDICGEFQPDIPTFESDVGIHTHGDGVIHIHPFSQLGVGANATLERFFQDARDGGQEISLSNDKLTYLGKDYEEGKTKCDGVEDPELRMAYWSDVEDPASEPEVTTGDFTDLRLTTNGAGMTIFYGDPKADIPKPPHADQLAELGAADGGQVPDDQGNTTTTTVPTDSSTTTAPGATTTAADPETTTTAAP